MEIVQSNTSAVEVVNIETSGRKIETVHAVAHFENMANNTLAQDDLRSLEKFVFSEKHLEDNIANFEYKVISNFEMSILFNVKTGNIWENSRQYLWKHLGEITTGTGKTGPGFGSREFMSSDFPPNHI